MNVLSKVFRHGERNVMTPYPNSLYKNESFWIGGRGALTKVIDAIVPIDKMNKNNVEFHLGWKTIAI